MMDSVQKERDVAKPIYFKALTNLGLHDQFKQSLYQKVQVSVLSSTPQTQNLKSLPQRPCTQITNFLMKCLIHQNLGLGILVEA